MSSDALADPRQKFSRASPSPRYSALVAMYRDLHLNGERRLGMAAEETFSGLSMPATASRIRKLIVEHKARTVLDYGAGKGMQYGPLSIKMPSGQEFTRIRDFWGVDSIVCYDPAFPPFSELPTGKFDGVITTDMMEHCPEEDLPWIIGEIFGFANRFVFGNIASYPALKHLPNGENAHCTVRPVEWWESQVKSVASRHPHLRYRFDVDLLVPGSDGKMQVRTVTLQG